MHNRQSGAAHVPMVFFLILLVLFIGALAFAYTQVSKNNELEGQNNRLQQEKAQDVAKIKIRDHYIEDIGNVIKMPGEYKGRPSESKDYRGEDLKSVPGVMDPAGVQAKMDATATAMGVTTAKSLEGLFTGLSGALDAQKKLNTDMAGDRDKTAEEKRAIDAALRTAQADHTKAQQELKDQFSTAQASYLSSDQAAKQRFDQSQQSLREEQTKLSQLNESTTAEKKHLMSELGKVRGQNTALNSKIALINPPDVADGKIIVARNNMSLAFINLGRKDMLFPGTVFRVKAPKGDKNADQVKGYATVTTVEQDRAEVQLTGVVDPIGNPVREGDELFNELYSPGVTRNIFLLGRFDYPVNKPELEKLLTRWGNKVYQKMVPGVDLVILGNVVPNAELDGTTPVTDLPEYKEAINLGVEMEPLHKIRDLIKP
jgi:hypothetical protein